MEDPIPGEEEIPGDWEARRGPEALVAWKALSAPRRVGLDRLGDAGTTVGGRWAARPLWVAGELLVSAAMGRMRTAVLPPFGSRSARATTLARRSPPSVVAARCRPPASR